MLRPSRPTRAVAGAAAGAALVSVLLAVPAHAAPVAASGSTTVLASVSASVRIVTPPTRVSRSALVRLMRNAGKSTDKALFGGAKLLSTTTVGGVSATSLGRTRAGRSSTRDARGAVILTDYRSGRGWLRISDLVAGLQITPEQLAAALASLGKAGASWAVITTRPTTTTVRPSGTENELVGMAKAASDWRWKRAKGITTWRLTPPRTGPSGTLVIGLDKRQRIVREDLTMRMTKPVRATVRASLLARYGDVTPIVLPTDAQSVGFFDLLMALLEQADDSGRTVPVGDATARAAAVEAQVQALRSMSGR
jgi:hypothetical protein